MENFKQENIDYWEEAGGIGILHKNADDTIKQLDYIISDGQSK